MQNRILKYCLHAYKKPELYQQDDEIANDEGYELLPKGRSPVILRAVFLKDLSG